MLSQQITIDRKHVFTKIQCLYVCKTRRKVKKHVTRFDMPIGCFENKLKFRFTKIVDYLCKNIKYLYLHMVSKQYQYYNNETYQHLQQSQTYHIYKTVCKKKNIKQIRSMIHELKKCISKYIVEHLNHHCIYRITSYQTTEISNLYYIIFIKIISLLINI